MRYPKQWMNWLVLGTRIAALSSIAAVGLYVVVGLQVIRVPAGVTAMQPAFSPGESLLVKIRLPFTRLARGDVVFYRSAGGSSLARVAGLPGESLTLQNGALFINGCEVDYPYTSAENEGNSTGFGPVRVADGKVLLLPDTPPTGTEQAVTRWMVPLSAVHSVVMMKL